MKQQFFISGLILILAVALTGAPTLAQQKPAPSKPATEATKAANAAVATAQSSCSSAVCLNEE